MKICPSCGEAKNEDAFYTGVRRCKECHRAAVRARYHERMQDPEFAASERTRNRKRVLEKYHAEKKHDPEYWARHQEKISRHRARRPEEYRARMAVNNALRDGRLTKPDRCSQCGAVGPVEGHHPDYSKPLEVIWLCVVCHVNEHQQDAA